MKSIEDKAKAYDNIIEKANKMHSENCEACQMCIEELIPELAESEDERIRKGLIEYFLHYPDHDITYYDLKSDSVISWLEKQGEQKPAEFDDTNAKRMFIKALERVDEQNAKGYKLTDCDKNSWWEDFKAYTSCTIEQKPAAWSDEDEKQARQIERIVHDDGCTQKLQKQIADWFKSIKERCNWKPSDEQMDALRYVTNFDYGGHKATLVSLYEQLKKLK